MNRNRIGSLLVVLLALALTFVVAGCGDDKGSSGESADVNSEGLDASGCKPAEKPAPKEATPGKPTEKLDPDKTYTVTFQTNCGDIAIQLDVKNNPKTAASFAHLVEEGVYEDTWFHRIVPDFVIQGGDPSGNGTGGVDYSVTEEPTGKYDIGTVAMAKTGNEPAGTSGSQFYIVIGQQGTTLPPDYAIAGKVVDGDDTTQRIASYAGATGGTGQEAPPTGAAVIEKATLTVE